MIDTFRDLFIRDLKKLKQEIELYREESSLWKVESSINNSGGNLCLHLVGNLNAYLGAGVAKTDYIRNRPYEFSAKNVDRNSLLQAIDETIEVVGEAMDKLKEEDLKKPFPVKIWQEETGMAFTLIHLHGHLTYHLGQINYHRRLLDK